MKMRNYRYHHHHEQEQQQQHQQEDENENERGKNQGERQRQGQRQGQRRCQHHHQLLSLCTIMVALTSLTMVQNLAYGTTEIQETPLALPVAEQTQPTTASQGEIWEEDDHEILIRNERGTKNDGLSCRYGKNPWTECDTKTNTRSRTLTLKKGDPACDQTRTIQKKCKKACRYEKGNWSECATGQMTRADKLKATSDPSCETTRIIKKNCKPGKSKDKTAKEQRKNKEKGARKNRA